mgnify:CR=1 FL=1
MLQCKLVKSLQATHVGHKMAESRLGSKVRSLRRRQGLTQAKLAEKLGISTSYLNLIENNRRPLSAPVLIKLAQLFQVDRVWVPG